MSRISTCLWFEKEAEAAARLYTSVVPNSRVTRIGRAPANYPGGAEGDVLTVDFELDGVGFMGLNGGKQESYGNAASIMVACDTQAEIDRLWQALVADGGQEIQCGWLRDRWGVPWQVFPRRMTEVIAGPDRAAARRVFEAMTPMVKIDLAAIERAAAGR